MVGFDTFHLSLISLEVSPETLTLETPRDRPH
jgi:hypothetical protein